MSKKKQKSIEELLKEALVPEEEQPYKVPENWVWVNLKYLLSSLETGKRPKGGVSDIREGIPSLGGEHLNYNGGFNLENIKFVPVDFVESMTKGIIKENDILIVKDGATTGKTAFVSSDFPFEKAVVNEHVFICRSSEKIYSKFLFYYILSLHGQKSIKDNLKGSAQGGINTSFVNKFPIPLATLNEQKRIAEKVERLFAKIDEAKRLIEEVKESFELRRAAILDKAFRGELTKKWREQNKVQQSVEEWLEEIVSLKNRKKNKFNDQLDPSILENLFELPEGWKWVRLNDLIESSVYGTSAKANDDSTGTPVLRMGNIVDGFIQFTDLKYLPNDHIDVQKLDLEVGDLLFNRTNSYELVGKTALVDENIAGKATFASYLIRVRLFYKNILGSYVCHYINSHIGRNILLSMVTQQVGQANINSQKLASLPIPLPPREEVIEISKYLDHYRDLEEQITNVLKIETKIDLIKQSILSKAFRGELGTNDPTDEHAIELLKEVLKSK
ncbi:restriction endonuclease subunit S [Parageobacillus thermoglucosidasius]|uniref:restriction endonuclease subunit S n=1 Tax=Parageobacillus thermoglucosidasius TaxID=1426 RepID=UPI000B561348|nr:restriction endonuclease subunit S [Parageobacillus thermoglucosidasius]MBY6269792.1 hypothetical protein [Parageobacillus thermoglucosidasius]OUM92120.1 MAG: hypothetical protein BAA00_04335 [Parageobacillus thermoglucosidasius]